MRKIVSDILIIARELVSIDDNEIDSKIMPSNIRINYQYLHQAIIVLLRVFFSNYDDSKAALQKLQVLMNGNRTGLDTSKLSPTEKEQLVDLIAKNIWVRFYNSLPNEFSAPMQYLKGAFKMILKALYGVDRYKRSVYQIMDRKLNIDVEKLGYEGDSKKKLFTNLYNSLKTAIRMSTPMALNKMRTT